MNDGKRSEIVREILRLGFSDKGGGRHNKFKHEGTGVVVTLPRSSKIKAPIAVEVEKKLQYVRRWIAVNDKEEEIVGRGRDMTKTRELATGIMKRELEAKRLALGLPMTKCDVMLNKGASWWSARIHGNHGQKLWLDDWTLMMNMLVAYEKNNAARINGTKPILTLETGKNGDLPTKAGDNNGSARRNVHHSNAGKTYARSAEAKKARREKANELKRLRKAAGLTTMQLTKILVDLGLKQADGSPYGPKSNLVAAWESGTANIPDFDGVCALLRETKQPAANNEHAPTPPEPEKKPGLEDLPGHTLDLAPAAAPPQTIVCYSPLEEWEVPAPIAPPKLDEVGSIDVETAYRLVRSRFSPSEAKQFDAIWRLTDPALAKPITTRRHNDLWVECHPDGSVTLRPAKTQSAEIELLKDRLSTAMQRTELAEQKAREAERKLATLKELLA